MFRKPLLIVLMGMMLSVASFAQSNYYYGSDGPIQLTEDPSSYVIVTSSEDVLEKVSNRKSFAGMKSVEAFPYQRFAIVTPENAKAKTQDIVASLGLERDRVSIAPSLLLNDGFRVYLTPRIVFKPRTSSDMKVIMDKLNSFSYEGIEEVNGKYRVTLNDVNDALAVSNAIYETNLTQFSHPDFYAELTHHNDPLFDEQFQMHNTGQTIDGVVGTADADVNALEAWAITLGSSDIIVAVIDDGLEAHEDFNDAQGNSRIIGGFTPGSPGGDGSPLADGDHGVACGGIIAASHNDVGVRGVAPLVRLLSVNIFAPGVTNENISDGITWAKDNGADVMSNSWGYSSCTFSVPSLDAAMADANANGRNGKGSILVFASGNDFGTCVSYPANHPDVMAVGAFSNQGIKSNYSNAGPLLDISAPSNTVNPQPGAGVRTTDRMGGNGYTSGNYVNGFGGTSAACPVVAGVAALVLGHNPNLTSTELKNILTSTAKDFGDPGFDNEFGHGGVDAHAALQAAGGGGGPTCTDGVQNGQETGIDCGGPDCQPCGTMPTCDDGIQNGQETGVDCGGPDCQPCEMACTDATISITFDDYAEETSWQLTNASGVVIASGGPYSGSNEGDIYAEDVCLPDGCYTFTILDSYGDGICCAYGDGSYSVVSNGIELAGGGNFDFSEATDFCFGDIGDDTESPSPVMGLAASNVTSSSFTASWNASSDNVGVVSYLVELIGPSGTSAQSVTGTSVDYDGLEPSTEYSVIVTAFDAAGNQSVSGFVVVTTEANGGGGGGGEIFGHYFESGWDGWADGGSDAFRYAGTRSPEGTYSIRLRDNSGNASSMSSPSYDLSSYGQVVLDFSFYPNSMESGESFLVRVNNGSGWNTIETFTSGSDFNNNQVYEASVMIPGNLLTSNTSFRFECDASNNSDRVYIDAVVLTGASGGPTAANVIANQEVTSSIKSTGRILNIETGDLGDNDIMLSPNPTRGYVYIQSEDNMSEITVIGIDGKQIMNRAASGTEAEVNIDNYPAGVYLIKVRTSDEVISKKIVKF